MDVFILESRLRGVREDEAFFSPYVSPYAYFPRESNLCKMRYREYVGIRSLAFADASQHQYIAVGDVSPNNTHVKLWVSLTDIRYSIPIRNVKHQ